MEGLTTAVQSYSTGTPYQLYPLLSSVHLFYNMYLGAGSRDLMSNNGYASVSYKGLGTKHLSKVVQLYVSHI